MTKPDSESVSLKGSTGIVVCVFVCLCVFVLEATSYGLGLEGATSRKFSSG